MPQRLPGARESVTYYQSLTLGPELLRGQVQITGYEFKLALTRQLGQPAEITLGMAASPFAQGFAVVSGPARILTIRIFNGTLDGLADTTGDFELFGDLLARPPGGEFFFVADLILPITKGPTAP